jgi:hypothetical protein
MTDWTKLTLASAWTTLDARDALLPAKLQRAVAPSSMQEAIDEAKAARAAFLAASTALIREFADTYMPSDEAAACFETAARSLRVEACALEGDESNRRCVFGGDKGPGRMLVTTYGNRRPGGGREEVTFLMTPEWVPVLEAAAVVCNATEWLDQEVAAWLDGASAAKVLTRELADRLAADAPLNALATTYDNAKAALLAGFEF